MLAREAGIGWLLWHAQAQDRPLDLVLTALLLGLFVALTRFFAITPSRNWTGTALEVAALFTGGACMANLARLAFGPPAPFHL